MEGGKGMTNKPPHQRKPHPPARTSPATISPITLTASGCASLSTFLPISRRRAGSSKSAARSLDRKLSIAASLLCTRNTAAPAAANTSAFLNWWLSAAVGRGTSPAAFPAAASSATVLAPLRHRIRSASANRRGISSRNAATSQRVAYAPLAPYAASTGSANFAPAWCNILNPGTSSIRPFTILGITSLKMRAPWLPPNTSNRTVRDGSSFCGSSPIAKNSRRTGIPVTRAPRKYRRVSSKFTAAALTHLPTSRFASPGTAFGSNASVGTCSRIAAIIAGPEAYPPTPTTTSGLKLHKSPTNRITPSGRSNNVRTRVARLTYFNCPTWINSSENPASGTSLVSNPRAVPTNHTPAPYASRSSRAIASAGITCPPLPPPAIRTRNSTGSLTASIDLTRHIQQHAHAGQRQKNRRPTRRDERQRNPLRRQQRQHHAHIEEGLNQD